MFFFLPHVFDGGGGLEQLPWSCWSFFWEWWEWWKKLTESHSTCKKGRLREEEEGERNNDGMEDEDGDDEWDDNDDDDIGIGWRIMTKNKN